MPSYEDYRKLLGRVMKPTAPQQSAPAPDPCRALTEFIAEEHEQRSLPSTIAAIERAITDAKDAGRDSHTVFTREIEAGNEREVDASTRSKLWERWCGSHFKSPAFRITNEIHEKWKGGMQYLTYEVAIHWGNPK